MTKVFLIGFMGSGKTTLGKRLAKQLETTFFDLDEAIEKEEGISINKIFERQGEQSFRGLESEVLNKLIDANESFVMALGGGTPCFNDNMNMINASGVSIYLKYNVGILSSRLRGAKENRPLIKDLTDMELAGYIENKISERESYYAQSKFILEGNNIKVADLIQLLE